MFRDKIYIIIAILLLFVLKIQAQNNFITEDDNTDTKKHQKTNKLSDRLVEGGNFYINFWGDVFEINVSPILGYKVNNNFLAGVGLFVDYQHSDYYKYTATILGGKVFGRYFLYKNFFTQSEFERLRISFKYNNIQTNSNTYFYDGLYVGLGYNLGEIRNSGLTIMIMYDLLYNDKSIYNSPLSFRIGINF